MKSQRLCVLADSQVADAVWLRWPKCLPASSIPCYLRQVSPDRQIKFSLKAASSLDRLVERDVFDVNLFSWGQVSAKLFCRYSSPSNDGCEFDHGMSTAGIHSAAQ